MHGFDPTLVASQQARTRVGGLYTANISPQYAAECGGMRAIVHGCIRMMLL